MHQTIQQNAEFLNEFIKKDEGTIRGYDTSDLIVEDFRRYQDVCWSSLGLVSLAMTYLPKFPGHAIVQRKSGSDKAEEAFCYKRGMNPKS